MEYYGHYLKDCDDSDRLNLLKAMLDSLYQASDLLDELRTSARRQAWESALCLVELVVYSEHVPKARKLRDAARVSYLDNYGEQTVTEMVSKVGSLALDVLQHMGMITGGVAGVKSNNHVPTAKELARTRELIQQVADYPLADLRDPGDVTPGMVAYDDNGLSSWSA